LGLRGGVSPDPEVPSSRERETIQSPRTYNAGLSSRKFLQLSTACVLEPPCLQGNTTWARPTVTSLQKIGTGEKPSGSRSGKVRPRSAIVGAAGTVAESSASSISSSLSSRSWVLAQHLFFFTARYMANQDSL